jgi:hypothetical protein
VPPLKQRGEFFHGGVLLAFPKKQCAAGNLHSAFLILHSTKHAPQATAIVNCALRIVNYTCPRPRPEVIAI